MVLLSLIPPIDWFIRNPPNEYWLWMILIAGFFGVFTLFIKTSVWIKVIALTSFLNCFFSVIPYVSFTSYVSVILGCYLYITATKIENWDLLLKGAQAVLILNVFIITMSLFGKDNLMNFGMLHVEHFGSIGQHMQMGSFSIVITSLLLIFSKLNIVFPFILSYVCGSIWTLVSASVGVCIYLLRYSKKIASYAMIFFLIIAFGMLMKNNKVLANLDNKSGRVVVWEKSIQLANQRPLTGWGIGTYKDIFHPLSGLKCFPYRTAHNFIIQLIFEVGYPLTICLLFALGRLWLTLFKKEQWLLLAGYSMILIDGLVHFPERCIQMVPLIILFFAYTRFIIRRFN